MDLNLIPTVFNSIKSTLVVFKEAKETLPDGSKRAEAAIKIEEAERLLKIAETETAKALGYNFCQCTFPPQIMLFEKTKNVFRCQNPECGREIKKKKE